MSGSIPSGSTLKFVSSYSTSLMENINLIYLIASPVLPMTCIYRYTEVAAKLTAWSIGPRSLKSKVYIIGFDTNVLLIKRNVNGV